MEKRINKTTLLNFLNGGSSKEEAAEVNRFLKTADGQNLLNELLNEHWVQAGDEHVDETKVLKWKEEWRLKFQPEAEEVKTRKFNLNTVLRYAAVFTALILGVGIYMVSKKQSETAMYAVKEQVKKNPMGRRSDFTLSDGTHIYLGPGSSLSFPEKFSGSKREVKLDGEAYFEVTKNKEKPFIIYSRNIRTQVLGTTFKVSAFKDSPVLVSVTSGRVRVDRISGDQVQELATLYPGEQVSYNQQSQVRKSNFNIENIKNWKTGQLSFDGTPLSELTNQISRWYNVPITIRTESLKQIPITVTLDGNMPLYKFLDVLSGSFGFNYKVNNQAVTIY